MSLKNGKKLLIDIERLHGRLRLDKGRFKPDHGDENWDRRIVGKYAPELIGDYESTTIDMFESPTFQNLRNAACILLSNEWSTLQEIPLGWTSIPIVNACAVKRQNSTAIAINIRLSTSLQAANALNCEFNRLLLHKKLDEAKKCNDNIREVMTGSSSEKFSEIVYRVDPYKSRIHNWISTCFTILQLLFILLHEYGHVVLGHLNDLKLWEGHPLSKDKIKFFSGAIEKEFEADRFALTTLFDLTKWKDICEYIEVLDNSKGFRSAATFFSIVQLFIWFDTMAPHNKSEYYKIPKSHPHPLDRAEYIIRQLKNMNSPIADDFGEVEKSADLMFKLYGRDYY